MAQAVGIIRTELDAAGLRRAASRSRDATAAHAGLGAGAGGQVAHRSGAGGWLGPANAARLGPPLYEAGPAGLSDRHGGGARPLLLAEQEAELAEWVRQGPDLAKHGVVRWRRAHLARAIQARFGIVLAERSISDVLRRLGFRRLVARPRHPNHDPAAQVSFSATSPPS